MFEVSSCSCSELVSLVSLASLVPCGTMPRHAVPLQGVLSTTEYSSQHFANHITTMDVSSGHKQHLHSQYLVEAALQHAAQHESPLIVSLQESPLTVSAESVSAAKEARLRVLGPSLPFTPLTPLMQSN
jgi:hypothetical protein